MSVSDIRAFIANQRHLLSGEKYALETERQRCSKSTVSADTSGALNQSEFYSPEDSSGHDSDSSLNECLVNLSVSSHSNSPLAGERFREDTGLKECARPSPKGQISQIYSDCQSPLNPQDKFASSKAEIENILTPKHECDREEQIRSLQEKLSVASFWDNFGTSATTKAWHPKVEDTMVRVGEFSPAHPHLHAPGKAHLGLGEYEERRRQLLERKKQEYKEYLSQSRNLLLKTDHFHPSAAKYGLGEVSGVSTFNSDHPYPQSLTMCSGIVSDAATQTDLWLMQPTVVNSDSTVSVVPANANGFITTDGLSLTVPSVDSPLPSLSPRVPRAHISQTTEQLPDSRSRQLQLQEELRQQIEEKKRLEAERRERERLEEEALQRRVAEQQARLQAEYEREEQLRTEREKQKQQQMEDFQRRQEELKAEAEQLKQEKRQRRQESSNIQGFQASRLSQNAHIVPHIEPAPISILKTSSPPPRSPRRAVSPAPSDVHINSPMRLPEQLPQPSPPLSPRALIKVLDGPTCSSSAGNLNDTLPIPLMPVAHSYAPARYSSRSPRRSPRRSPSRAVPHSHKSATQQPSSAMQNLEDRWKIPAVQKNQCVREQVDANGNNSRSVLTQLGTFRRQLQMAHMRMEEKVRETQHHQPYQQHQFERHHQQQTH